MRRCNRCVNSDRIPNLTFDAHGVCSICREWDARPALDFTALEREFARTMELQKAKGGSHDVVLGFSGGKDSAYGLYLLKERYGIDPLLINFDNGFQTEWGQRVMKLAEERFGVRIERHRAPEASYSEAVRASFTHTADVCLQCDLEVYSTLFRVARERGIDTVVMGGGASEGLTQSSPMRAIDVFRYAESHYERDGIDCSRFRVDEELVRGIRLLQLGDYFRWDHAEIKSVLAQRLGDLFAPEIGGGYIHGDCALCRVQDYCRYKKRGFSRNEPSLSALVRTQTMARDAAIRLIEADEADADREPQELDAFCQRTGLSRESVRRVLSDPSIKHQPPWFHRKKRAAEDTGD